MSTAFHQGPRDPLGEKLRAVSAAPSSADSISIPARAIVCGEWRTPKACAALRRHMLPIALAPKVCWDELILWDGTSFCIGQRWKHWSMAEPVWWSNTHGQVLPTYFIEPDATIQVGNH